jgi:hypothetical protein
MFRKKRGYIDDNGSLQEMDGTIHYIPPNSIKEIIVVFYEIIFVYTNHNLIGDK